MLSWLLRFLSATQGKERGLERTVAPLSTDETGRRRRKIIRQTSSGTGAGRPRERERIKRPGKNRVNQILIGLLYAS